MPLISVNVNTISVDVNTLLSCLFIHLHQNKVKFTVKLSFIHDLTVNRWKNFPQLWIVKFTLSNINVMQFSLIEKPYLVVSPVWIIHFWNIYIIFCQVWRSYKTFNEVLAPIEKSLVYYKLASLNVLEHNSVVSFKVLQEVGVKWICNADFFCPMYLYQWNN